MRILVTVPFSPWPVTRGTDRLIVNLLEGLAARHRTILSTMTLGGGELARLEELEDMGVSVEAMIAPHRRGPASRMWCKLRNLSLYAFHGVPPEVGYAAPREFLEKIARTAREREVDLVLASYWHMYGLPDRLTGPDLALVTHDIDFEVRKRRVEVSGGRYETGPLEERLEIMEREAYERFDRILTVTPTDAELLRSMPCCEGKTIEPLPLALDLSRFRPGEHEREDDLVLFLGSFDSDFNRDALLFFTGSVLPLIRGSNGSARLQVVGHGAGAELRSAAGEGVEFTGGVEDIRPYLGRCSVMVLPLRFSGGVRIRMMEAAAMGTPVVSTPAGVAGMDLTAGKEYLEAEDPEEMAAAVCAVLEDRSLGRRTGEAARRWAESRISMSDYPDRLDQMILDLNVGR